MEALLELVGELLIYPLGAFLCWSAKGFRGSFADELLEHDVRNAAVALVLLAGLVAAIVLVSTR